MVRCAGMRSQSLKALSEQAGCFIIRAQVSSQTVKSCIYTSALAILSCTLLLVGCPTDDPSLDPSDKDSQVPDAPDDTETADDTGTPDDTAAPIDPGTSSDGTADPGQNPDLAPPGDCQNDEDCATALGELGPCQVPLCEDGECFADAIPSGLACDDANPCTSNDICQSGTCAGLAMDCDDGNPCSEDSCTDGACENLALDGVPCSDGDPCTGPDVCKLGTCSSPPR